MTSPLSHSTPSPDYSKMSDEELSATAKKLAEGLSTPHLQGRDINQSVPGEKTDEMKNMMNELSKINMELGQRVDKAVKEKNDDLDNRITFKGLHG